MTDEKPKTCPDCGSKVLTKAEVCPGCIATSAIEKYQQSTIAKKAVDYALGHVGVNWATKAAAGFVIRRVAKAISKK